METSQVKSGKEILDDFFKEINSIKDVVPEVAISLASLYYQGKLTDINVKNELLTLREKKVDQD